MPRGTLDDQATSRSSATLYGREPECAAIDRLLHESRRSRSAVLVLRGEAGLGKSALLDHARRAGADLTALSVAGVEPESDLPYAALQRLLQPVLDHLKHIPAVQAEALRGALALGPGSAENRFAVYIAVLNLLAEAATDGPLLCLVDDAQWLDRPTADALAFVGRRLQAEGIVLIVAVREDSDLFPGLPTVRLAPLEPDAADTLLRGTSDTPIADDVRRAIRAAAQGNPLALLEIPAELSAAQLAGDDPLPNPMPAGIELERILLQRVRSQDPAVQTLLLVAAAEGSGQADIVTEAAARLGVPPATITAAQESGLIRMEQASLEFRHPLVRAAVYHGADIAQRRAAHRALVDVLGGDGNADRRAWHRAALTTGEDDELADELVETAERMRRRGGHATASAALRRAAELTTEAAVRDRRRIAAARAAWDGGKPGDAADLLRLVNDPEDPGAYAALRHLQGELELRCGTPAEGARLLLDGAERVAGAHPLLALRLLMDAALCAVHTHDQVALAQTVRHARSLPTDQLGAERSIVDVLAAVAGMVLTEHALTTDDLVRWLDRVGESTDPHALTWAASAATGIGDLRRQDVLRSRAEAVARSSASVGALVTVLERLAFTGVVLGDTVETNLRAHEGLDLAREAALPNPVTFHQAALSWVAAVRGDQDECLALADQAAHTARRHGLAPHLSITEWALGILHLGQGRWDEATTQLSTMSAPGHGHPFVTLLALPDLVEAAIHADNPALATSAADRFLAFVGDQAPAWQRSLAARCRSLLAPPHERERHMLQALDLLGREPRPFNQARTHLLLGEHLRRERRRADARPHLARAVTIFEQEAATPWADRARAELRATGARTGTTDPRSLHRLTTQQTQIARLVAEGASNKEIAAQLFLSPRTVDYHLRNVFSTLGISSRAELVRLQLQGSPSTRAPQLR